MLRSLFILALALAMPFAVRADKGDKQRYDRTYTERYEVNADAKVIVRSSFSELHVESVSGSTATLEVRVEVDATSPDKAEKLLDRLKVTMKGSRGEVSLTTDTGSEWNNKNENFKIIVTVRAPAGNRLDVDHQFGSATVGDFSGTAKLHSGFGNMSIGKLSGSGNEVKSSYGKTTVRSAGQGVYRSEFGELSIENLIGNAELKNAFGNLKVEQIATSVSNLDVNNEFGEMTLTLAPSASFKVRAESGFGDVDLPGDARVTSDKEAFTSRSTDAEIGQQTGNQLTINNSFGEVKIKRK